MESASAGIDGRLIFSAFTRSRPSSPPSSDRSTIARPGGRRAMASSAAWRLPASAQTTRSGSLSIRAVSPRRISGWSSTMRIAFFPGVRSGGLADMAPLLCWRRRQRKQASDNRTFRSSSFRPQPSADQTRPVVHRIQPNACDGGAATANSDAVVADAQASLPIAKAQADADSTTSSVRDGVAHRLLGDAIEVRLDRGVQTGKTTIAGEGARDRVKRLDIRRQDLQRGGEPHLREAPRVEAARVADRLLQQRGDLRCGRRRRVAAPSQLAGEGRAQRGDARQVLAQAVMQLAPHALLFPIAGLDQRSFKPRLAGDVARRRANRLPLRQEDRVPQKPPVDAVLAPKAILKVDGS